MTDPAPETPEPSKPGPSKLGWWIAGGVVAVVILGGGLIGLSALDDAGEPGADGTRLNIAVVAPVEPDIQPGEVMDVGQLNNGFDGRMPQQTQTNSDANLYADQPAYDEGDQGWKAEDRWAPGARPSQIQTSRGQGYVQPGPDGDPYANARARPPRDAYQDKVQDRGQDRAQERPMSFGFDRPQPDWRAEREARRAALEAREQAREQERYARRYGSSGDRPTYRDSY